MDTEIAFVAFRFPFHGSGSGKEALKSHRPNRGGNQIVLWEASQIDQKNVPCVGNSHLPHDPSFSQQSQWESL